MRKLFIALLLIVITTTSVMASGEKVISLAKDLNESQRTQMKNLLGADENTKIIETTNEEEKRYLGKFVASELIGNRATSSASVEILNDGNGIQVETYNITWVTEDMIISSLVTAGIKDAKVKVVAPFEVSGTAALTGIIKAFEDATGSSISEVQKEVANEEIAKTGELGQDIGKDEASELVKRIKEEIIAKDINSVEDIQKVISDTATELNITLTPEQEAKLSELMKKISSLDLNVEDIKSQLKNITNKLGKLTENSEEVKGILQKILDAITQFFASIFNK